MNGLTVYNKGKTQFSTKYPAFLVDRTSSYGYKNYQVTFASNPPLPPDPPLTPGGTTSALYTTLIPIYHGLRYIPAFESVTVGFGLATSWNGGISMWNEDALLSFTLFGVGSTVVCNKLLFRTDTQNLYVTLFRQSITDGSTIYRPPSLAGVQLNINTQIFAMGLNDIPSNVL